MGSSALTAVVSLLVVRLNRELLDINDTFPEILRLALAGKVRKETDA